MKDIKFYMDKFCGHDSRTNSAKFLITSHTIDILELDLKSDLEIENKVWHWTKETKDFIWNKVKQKSYLTYLHNADKRDIYNYDDKKQIRDLTLYDQTDFYNFLTRLISNYKFECDKYNTIKELV